MNSNNLDGYDELTQASSSAEGYYHQPWVDETHRILSEAGLLNTEQ